MATRRREATLADLRAIPEEERFHELVDGELIRKAAPGLRHATVHGAIAAALEPARRRDGAGPAGWILALEVDVVVGKNLSTGHRRLAE